MGKSRDARFRALDAHNLATAIFERLVLAGTVVNKIVYDYLKTFKKLTAFKETLDQRIIKKCRNVFLKDPNDVAAAVQATNLRYGGLEGARAASRVIITNGALDPWRKVSMPPTQGSPVRDPFGVHSLMVPELGHCKWDEETTHIVEGVVEQWLEDYWKE